MHFPILDLGAFPGAWQTDETLDLTFLANFFSIYTKSLLGVRTEYLNSIAKNNVEIR